MEGSRGVADRLRIRIARSLVQPGSEPLPVRMQDLQRGAELAAGGWRLPPPLPAAPGERLAISWVCAPPGAGSGGHTNMFRIASTLERAGHHCTFYLHDRHGWQLDQHLRVIRHWWPWLTADVRHLDEGIADSHIVLATSWETAYPVLVSPARGIRCYFVQDLESAFHPAGSAAMLAEATYGFGFHGVTLGKWLAETLRRDYGMQADAFDFGCDVERYRLDPSTEDARLRRDVCYYCRPSTPRRAHELAVLALQLFAERHPGVAIHVFGEDTGRFPFPVVRHGLLTPEALSRLYRRCIAGLCLSATNVSLAPLEMLAAGCIPVVNDAAQNRRVLDHPDVAYAPAAPFALAKALGDLVSRGDEERSATAVAASASVTATTWEDAGRQVEQILSRVVADRMAASLAP